MQRNLVMGSSGSGKSTFVRRLSNATGIPFVSLDALFWNPGSQASDAAVFEARVTEAANRARWVMDGNYTGRPSGELRRQLADTIIWFDLPQWSCMTGILKRIARSYGQVRPEMAEGCPEKIDFELRPDQTVVCFTGRAQADRYLMNMVPSASPVSVC